MASITSANLVITLTIPGLYPIPQRLSNFATDDAFDSEASDIAETPMGVDGNLSAGYIPAPVVTTIHFQADSPSIGIFDTWDLAEAQLVDKLPAGGTFTLPGVKRQYLMLNGFLRNVKRMPDARKTLQPMQYTIVWGSRIPSPMI
jgi:hypothetical protein